MGDIFTVEESNLICVYESKSRVDVMEDIRQSLSRIDDEEMIELSKRVLEKLEKLTDDEFNKLGLEAAE